MSYFFVLNERNRWIVMKTKYEITVRKIVNRILIHQQSTYNTCNGNCYKR